MLLIKHVPFLLEVAPLFNFIAALHILTSLDCLVIMIKTLHTNQPNFWFLAMHYLCHIALLWKISQI